MFVFLVWVFVDVVLLGVDWQVFDVGCGIGVVSLVIVGWLGIDGYCMGVDIFVLMIDIVCVRVCDDVVVVIFLVVDVQCYVFLVVCFDCVVLCFGVMFFDDLQCVFVGLCDVICIGGVLYVIVWCVVVENLFMIIVECVVVLLFLLLLCFMGGLGQFVFVDCDVVVDLLVVSGWIDIWIELLDVVCCIMCVELMCYVVLLGLVGQVLCDLDVDVVFCICVLVVMDVVFVFFIDGDIVVFIVVCWVLYVCVF